MTLIVLGISYDKQEIECISDTRVSRDKQFILSESTAKVIPFTAISTFSINKPKKKRIEWREELCFCFAGSTLLANSVFALGSNICRNIYTSKVRSRPSLEVYAEFFRFALEHVGRDLKSRAPEGSRKDGIALDVELAVFGYDKVDRRAKVFIIRQKVDDGQYSAFVEKYPENAVFVALGEKIAFNREMMNRYELLKKHGLRISILEAFKAILADNNVKGVGGGVQVCFVDKNGIEIPVSFDIRDGSIKLFGIPCDTKTNYASDYTIGDISEGAIIRGY